MPLSDALFMYIYFGRLLGQLSLRVYLKRFFLFERRSTNISIDHYFMCLLSVYLPFSLFIPYPTSGWVTESLGCLERRLHHQTQHKCRACYTNEDGQFKALYSSAVETSRKKLEEWGITVGAIFTALSNPTSSLLLDQGDVVRGTDGGATITKRYTLLQIAIYAISKLHMTTQTNPDMLFVLHNRMVFPMGDEWLLLWRNIW